MKRMKKALIGLAVEEVPTLRLAVATLRLERDCDSLGVRDVAEALCAELSALAHTSPSPEQVAL